MFIKELLDLKGKVNLFTRPRRFGKTLNLSMLRYFFEDTGDPGKNECNKGLFQDLKIINAGERYTSHMGMYPVLNLTLKSAKQENFEKAYYTMQMGIGIEFERHRSVIETGKELLSPKDYERYVRIAEEKADEKEVRSSLQLICRCMHRITGKNTVILIDEYDVPLENAYFRGFYEEMVDFTRSLFESALKTNDYLQFAVITGCLRISKESIFTGLNHLKIISILDQRYSEHFGFTEAEVRQIMAYYGVESRFPVMKEWYDGYTFGNTEVYNPWSIINYVETAVSDINAFPKPYWSNTSSNSIVRELIETADPIVRQDVERLANGGTIEVEIHEDITYDTIHQSQNNLWNFLFFTGYLKKISERLEGQNIYLEMAIPNDEVLYVYRQTVMEWFEQQVKQKDFTEFYQALAEKDCATIEQELNRHLSETISFYDYAESYYHGFFAGLLRGHRECAVRSNRESGNGRPDLVIYTLSVRGMAIIIEIKVAKKFEEMEAGCDAALAQIEEQNYQQEWYEIGYRNIIKYGVCFYHKECMVKGKAYRVQ